MEPRITIITLGVTDLPRSLRFYRDGLRLRVRGQFPDAVFFQLGSVRLGLYPRDLLARDANVSPEGGASRVSHLPTTSVHGTTCSVCWTKPWPQGQRSCSPHE